MRTSNKTIMVVLGVGAVLGLAGQVMAQSGSYRGRDGYRGGSDSRSSYGHSGSYSRPSYGHSGFGGGFSIGFGGGFVESPRFYPSPRIIVAPRVITPGWTSYGYPVYAAPTCGVSRPVFVAPPCYVRPPMFVPSFYPHHRYEQPTWRHDWR